MRRLLVLLILILHVNTSMFIPVMDEADIYDEQGNQVGDINSLIQLVDSLVFGHVCRSSVDQDDDQAHYFTIAHHIHPYIINKIAHIAPAQETMPLPAPEKNYNLPCADRLLSITYDITVPPPRA